VLQVRVPLHLLVIWRWFVVCVDGEHPLDGLVPRLFQMLPLAVLARVQPLAVRRVNRFRGGRPIKRSEARSGKGRKAKAAVENETKNPNKAAAGRQSLLLALTFL
jgi:hypothetical protein